jgi:hypothetical protein
LRRVSRHPFGGHQSILDPPMKILKQILELFNSVVKSWPSVVIVIGWLSSFVLWLVHIGQTPVSVSLPLSIVITILTIALYPIAKVVQSVYQRSPFPYQGLMWEPKLWGCPLPIRPMQGCGQKVFAKNIPPRLVQVVRPNDWEKNPMKIHHQYECPLHGTITSVPDWPIDELRKKAKSVQRSRPSSNK